MRDPISVGIDPVRELLAVVFCGVGNTIEVVSNIVLVRDEIWQSSQSFKTARLCTRFCTTLTKVKLNQACERSDLNWNRPSKAVFICIFCGVGNTIEVVSIIVSVKDENWQSSQSFKQQEYVRVFARHLLK